MLQSWSINFSFMVNNEAAPGGTIDSRIQGDDTQISYLATQISNLNTANAAKQQRPGQRVRADGGDALVQPVDEQLADQPDRGPADAVASSNGQRAQERPTAAEHLR